MVEDGYFNGPCQPISPAIGGLLDEIAAFLRCRIEWRADYVALRELFVAVYGEGGTCHDVAAFLCRAAEELRFRRPSNSSVLATPFAPRPPVPATVLMQLSAASDVALAKGDALAVINSVYSGCGQLSARHAMGNGQFHATLRDSLRQWMHKLAAPAEPVDLLVSGDCNDLQAHPRLTHRVLACPSEAVCDEHAFSWRDLRLQHRPDTGTIDIQAAGSSIRPIYLGATLPHPGWGPTYWLIMIANPLRARPPDPPSPPVEIPQDVFVNERQVVGRVVARRISWWMSARRARRIWFGRTGVRRSLDTALDCARLGLPSRFFVTARSLTRPIPTNRQRKPFWVDIHNPLLLDTIEPLLGDAEYICITEALPDIPHWPKIQDRAHASELHVELVL